MVFGLFNVKLQVASEEEYWVRWGRIDTPDQIRTKLGCRYIEFSL